MSSVQDAAAVSSCKVDQIKRMQLEPFRNLTNIPLQQHTNPTQSNSMQGILLEILIVDITQEKLSQVHKFRTAATIFTKSSHVGAILVGSGLFISCRGMNHWRRPLTNQKHYSSPLKVSVSLFLSARHFLSDPVRLSSLQCPHFSVARIALLCFCLDGLPANNVNRFLGPTV